MDCKMSEQSAIVLAAGTAITMACIKHIMVMFFAEQWRTKVFLVLNLVLLAIFCTSVRSSNSCSNGLDEESSKNEEVKVGKMKRRKLQCRANNGLSESRDSYKVCDSKRVSDENLIGVEVVSSAKGSRVQFSSGVNKMTHRKSDENVVEVHEVQEKQFEVDESDQCSNKLSKEELNERAEAFIAMFRQHLALDARQGNINSHWNVKANRVLSRTPNY